MLLGKKCKVGSRTDQSSVDFTFYSGIIVSEPSLGEDGDFRVLVMTKGRLITANTYYIYDIEDAREVACRCMLNLGTCNC